MQSTSVSSRVVRLLRSRDATDSSCELEDDDDDDDEEEQFRSSADTICCTIRLPSYCSRSIFIWSLSSSSSSSSNDRSITAACEDDEEYVGSDFGGAGSDGSSPCSRQEVDSSSDTTSGCSNFTLKSSNFCRFRI